MANEAVLSTTVKVALDTKGQTREQVHEAIDLILNRVGCRACGLMHVVTAEVAENPTRK